MSLLVGSRRALLSAPGLIVRSYDEFTDANGTLLPAHVASDGGSWTKHAAASGAGDSSIDANMLHNTTDGTNHVYFHSFTPGTANYDVSCVLALLSDNNASNAGPCARMDDTAVTFYHARYNTVGDIFQLYKFVAGTATQLGSNAGSAISVGARPVLTLSVFGSTIRMLLDGAVLVSATDSAITAIGKAGVRTANAASAAAGLNLDSWKVAA